MALSPFAVVLLSSSIALQTGGQEVPPGYTPYSSYTPMLYTFQPTLVETKSGDAFTVTATITDQDTSRNSNNDSMLYGCYHTEWVWGDLNHPESMGMPNVQKEANGKNVFSWIGRYHGTLNQTWVLKATPKDYGGASTGHNNPNISDGLGNTQTLTITIVGSGSTPGGGGGGPTGPGSLTLQ